jgi:tripartite-type tricarboxylate transporter receptor subunit TctC
MLISMFFENFSCAVRVRREGLWRLTVMLMVSCGLVGTLHGADYPVKPIRYVIPSAPGGNADLIGRLMAQRLNESLGQPVVVDNRAGASNVLGTEYVVKSAPDGYTLLQIASAHFTNPSLVKKLPYDSERDLAPIGLFGSTPLILVVHPSLPGKTVKDLVALAKARPGQLNYSSAGVGTSGHLAGALMGYLAKINIVHVPYRGTAQSMTDVLSGDLHFAFPSMTSGLQYVKSGKLKALGMTGTRRSQLAPYLPTISEAGVIGYQSSIWNGLLAPAGTPAPIIMRLNSEIVRILSVPDSRERFASMGSDVSPSSPGDFGTFIAEEIKKWSTVITAVKIQAE